MSEQKERVLVFLTRAGRAVRPKEVAEKLGLASRTVTPYLLALLRQGYVARESRGLFVLTAAGREVAARIERASEEAAKLLAEVPSELGFRFYSAVGRPAGVMANSLAQFRDALQKVDLDSVSFHLERGDFEQWLSFIGDKALAESVGRMKPLQLQAEEARKKLVELVENRIRELRSAIR
ncbi:MAG: DUF5752 family protein [Candidatus Bathyarchaeia archaeon]